MKQSILSFLFCLIFGVAYTQSGLSYDYSDIVDITIAPDPSGDSARYVTQIIYLFSTLDVNQDTIVVDTAMITYSYQDSVALVDAAFAKVDKEQNILAGGERQLYFEDNVTADLVQINQALVALTGDNYFTLAYDRVPIVEGYWKIRFGGSNFFFSVAANGIATQVDSNGVPVGGGETGRFRIRSNERIELVNFTTSSLNQVYFSLKPSSRKYVNLNDDTVVTFIRNF